MIFIIFFAGKLHPLIKIAPDKWKHFLVGIIMGATLQIAVAYLMPGHFIACILTTFILVVTISYGFELFSLITKKGIMIF